MKIQQYILQKEALKIVDLAIINDYKTISHILSSQKNAQILLLGFDVLERRTYTKTTSSFEDPLCVDFDYKINLLEFSSSDAKFYPILELSFLNPLIFADLKEQLKLNIEQNNALTFKNFLGICNKDSNLRKLISKSFSFTNDELKAFDKSKEKYNNNKQVKSIIKHLV